MSPTLPWRFVPLQTRPSHDTHRRSCPSEHPSIQSKSLNKYLTALSSHLLWTRSVYVDRPKYLFIEPRT